MRQVRPPAARRPLALLLFAALAPAALAQHFAFVSTRVPDDLAGAYGRPPQSEVFLYRDGSEIRLTSTPHASEYDPTPSPGGRYVAFAALDHADEEAGYGAWGWQLAVVDTITRREVARWDLPGTVGSFRPAGGFQLAWLDQGTLLAQGLADDGSWEVHAFDLASGSSRRVTSGFGVVVAPDGASFATSRFDGVVVHEVDSGRERNVFDGAGVPLTWWRGGLLVSSEDGLHLVDVATATSVRLKHLPGLVLEAVADQGTEWLAYVRLAEGGGTTELVVVDADDVAYLVREGDWVGEVTWLGPGLLVYEAVMGAGDVQVEVSDLLGHGFVVDSVGEDFTPRAVPLR